MSDNLRKDSFWVGGKFTVQEIIKNSKRKILQIAIHEKNRNFLYKSQNKNIPIKIENDKFFNKLFKKDLDIHQGWAIEILPIPPIDLNTKLNQLSSKSLFLILDGINDARNIGSIIRSSAALGCDAIIIDKKNVKVSDEGYFVFGIDRDRKFDLTITKILDNKKDIILPNSCGFFGGEVNINEDHDKAIKRELYEELRIKKFRTLKFINSHFNSKYRSVFFIYSLKLEENIILKEGYDYDYFFENKILIY